MFSLYSLTKQQKNATPLMTFSLYHLCKEKNCQLRMLVFHRSQLRTKEEEQITHGQTYFLFYLSNQTNTRLEGMTLHSYTETHKTQNRT